MRANVLAGRRFSYMKAMHGSYKDPMPDAYELGAFMVSRVNRTAGPAAWNRIIRGWTRQSWNPFALSRAMRKETGHGIADTYADVVSEIDELWRAKAIGIQYTEARVLNRAPRSAWTNYNSPVYDSDGSVLAQKAGMADFPAALVRVHPDATEETLFHYAPALTNRLSMAGGRVLWQEYVPDPRWTRGWTRLVIHDLATGQRHHLAVHGRFEAPAFSPDGSRIAAIEFTPGGVCSLAIIDAKADAVRRFPVLEGEFLFAPAWSADGRSLAVIRQTANGMKALAIFNLESEAFSDVIAPSREDLTYPAFDGEYVLYGSPLNGIDNIHAVHIGTKARYQVTSARLGAYFPHISTDGRKLLFSDCTADGFNIAEQDLEPSSWRPVEAVESAEINYHETGAHDYTAAVPSTTFESRPYYPLGRLIDFHSWGVTSPPPDMGFGIHSTDKMGLLDLTASLRYD